MNTEYQEKFLDGISVLLKNALANSPTTRVIECEIVGIQDAISGVYTVKYTDNKFTAHSSNGRTYVIGDSVYVVVPDGDFSKNKLILGLIEAEPPRVTESQNIDQHYEISENFLTGINDIELCTYKTEIKYVDFDNEFIATLIPKYEHFVLQADFKTNIVDLAQRTQGNYGIKISIPIVDPATGEQGEIERTIDIYNMNGNIYNFENFITQKLYFDFAGVNYDPSREIVVFAFVKDFYQDPHIDTPDIFIKNIEFKAVEVLSEEEMMGTFLTIDATEGYLFLNGKYNSDKILTPKLMINGVSASIEGYECYWFKEDASIDIDNTQYYNSYGGRGWRILNSQMQMEIDKEGNPIYYYNTSVYTQTVKKTDILKAARYKVVLVNPNNVFQKIITIENLDSNIDFSLETPTGLTSFVKDAGLSVTLIAKLHYPNSIGNISFDYTFQRFDKFGNYLDDDFYTILSWDEVDKEDRITKINFPVALMEDTNIVKCEFVQRQPVNDEVSIQSIGTATISLSTGNQLYNYSLSVPNDNILFKYDANGNSPLVANYDGPYQSKITEIEPISFKLFKNTGDEFDTDEYSNIYTTWKFPKNSMLQLKGYDLNTLENDDNYYYIKEKGLKKLSYTIKNVFNNTLVDNTIFISVLFDNTEIQGKATINIIKDGESGTNGSQYAAIITHNGYAYEERDANGVPQKTRAIFINGYWKTYKNKQLIDFNSNDFTFNVRVYKNGSIIDPNLYTVSWGMFDPRTLDSCFDIDNNGTLRITNTIWNEDFVPVNIIQATIRIKESNIDVATDYEEIIYAYYPIDLIKLPQSSQYNFIPDIINGFSTVNYNSDGTNPLYNTNQPFEIKIIDGTEKYFDCEWYANEINLKEEEDYTLKMNQHKYRPISQYVVKDSKNYVKAVLTQNNAQSAQLNQDIDNIDQAILELHNKINYYGNEKAYLQTFLKEFSYDKFVEKLDSCSTYLTYRAKYLSILKNLIQILNEINEIDGNLNTTEIRQSINEVITKIYEAKSSSDIKNYDIKFNSEGAINYSVKDLIENFNNEVDKCSIAWNNILIYNNLDNELNTYNNLIKNTEGLVEKMHDLVSAHDNEPANQTFVTTKEMISNYSSYFRNIEKGYTKLWIEQNILGEIENLLSNYRNFSFIQEEYNKKIKNLNSELEENQIEVSEMNQSHFSKAVVIKPILFLLNRYSLASINGWDGNKLYTGKNNEYLVAPQIGAGKKENGLFTGIIMGTKKENNNTKIGLLGFSQGEESIYLDAKTGKATFGKPGYGQIIMDPNGNSTIAGWEINENSLSKTKSSGNKFVGLFADENNDKAFYAYDRSDYLNLKETYITYDGYLYTNNAKITGEIFATKGKIGGWIIDENSLNTENHLTWFKDDGSCQIGGYYGITYDGKNKVKFGSNVSLEWSNISDADTKATQITRNTISTMYIVADAVAAENISGTTISGKTISGGSISGCTISTYSGKFSVNGDGKMSCSEASISGEVNASSGSIGIWTFDKTYGFGNENDSSFAVTNDGYLYCHGIRVFKGTGNHANTGTAFDGQVDFDTIYTDVGYALYNGDYSKLATQGWVNAKSYLTSSSISNYVNDIDNGTQSSTYSSGNHTVVTSLAHNGHKLTANRAYHNLSDMRLKENICDLEDFSKVYMKLRPVKFNYKYRNLPWADSLTHYGVIAQELKKILDEERIDISHHGLWNLQDPEEDSHEKDIVGENGKVQIVDKGELHALHIQMIQKQQKEIEKLNQTIISLKGEIDIIKQQLRR